MSRGGHVVNVQGITIMRLQGRGTTGAARAPKPDKTPITRRRAAADWVDNAGITAVQPKPFHRPKKSHEYRKQLKNKNQIYIFCLCTAVLSPLLKKFRFCKKATKFDETY